MNPFLKALRAGLEQLKRRPAAMTIAGLSALFLSLVSAAGNYQTIASVMEAALGPAWLGKLVFSPIFPVICVASFFLLLWLNGERALAEKAALQAREEQTRNNALEAVRDLIVENGTLSAQMAECWIRGERLAAIKDQIQIAHTQINLYQVAVENLRRDPETLWPDPRMTPINGTFDRLRPHIEATYARGGAVLPNLEGGIDPLPMVEEVDGMVRFRAGENNRFFLGHLGRIDDLRNALRPIEEFALAETVWLEERRNEIAQRVTAD